MFHDMFHDMFVYFAPKMKHDINIGTKNVIGMFHGMFVY
jgi:hypothetical protein